MNTKSVGLYGRSSGLGRLTRCLLVLSGCLLWACQLPADPPDPEAKLPCIEPICASYRLDASTAGYEDSIYDAMAELNAWTGRGLYTVDNTVGDCVIKIERGCQPGGQWRPATNEVAICPMPDRMVTKQLMLHELLHSQGLMHVQGFGSIMSETVGPESGLTDLDYRECVSKRVCDCRVW